ncbi:uncharacterized protein LOC134539464 [Bacillus rossius redtenbacheri]|uniref:uncharacterized protein LOC134539464 n=1 Tax=Bacillus rossius redtenbacheri TaxID=93214 RepID=UPI002FDD540C
MTENIDAKTIQNTLESENNKSDAANINEEVIVVKEKSCVNMTENIDNVAIQATEGSENNKTDATNINEEFSVVKENECVETEYPLKKNQKNEDSCEKIEAVNLEKTNDVENSNNVQAADTVIENFSFAIGIENVENDTVKDNSKINSKYVESRLTKENSRENTIDKAEEHGSSTEEMVDLPDTFFDDLMDVEFLGSFDVVDSWKQDEDVSDEKSDGEHSDLIAGTKDEIVSSKADDKGKKINDNFDKVKDKTSRQDRRPNYYSRFKDWHDKNNSPDGKSQQSSSKSKNERSRSHSRNEKSRTDRRSTSQSMTDRSKSITRKETSKYKSKRRSVSKHIKGRSASRSRKERSTSRSKKERSTSKSRKERSTSRSRKERSTSRSRKERSTSRSRKERSTSRSRKERSTSRSRKERSTSKSRKERSTSRSRKERSTSRSRKERSTSRSRKEISYSRSRKERSTSRSRKERSTSRSRKERSTSRSRKERSTSRSRKERSTSRSRKERSTSRSRKERSTSRSRKERSTSRSRKERSTSRSREERSTSRSRKERSSLRSRKERSTSRSRKETSDFPLRKESLPKAREDTSHFRMTFTEIGEGKELQNIQVSKDYSDKDTVEYQNYTNTGTGCEPPLKYMFNKSLLNINKQPAPPGLEDIFPPGEEPMLIKPRMDTCKFNEQNTEKIFFYENNLSNKYLPVEKPRLNHEKKNETDDSIKRREQNENFKGRSDMETKQKRTDIIREDMLRNRESSREELKSPFKRDNSYSDFFPIDTDPRHSRSIHQSTSAERNLRDRYRTRERPDGSYHKSDRDIEHLNWLRNMAKQEQLRPLDSASDERMWDSRKRDYYPHRERQRSLSRKVSLSPISLSPVRSRYSRSPSYSHSHSRRKTRDGRRHRSRSRSKDSLGSLSLSSLSSNGSAHGRKYFRSRRSRRIRSKRKPFFEEIAQKLGIQTDSSEQPSYPPHHVMAARHQRGMMMIYGEGPALLPNPGSVSLPGAPPNLLVPPPNLYVPPPAHHTPQLGHPPPLYGPPDIHTAPPPVPYQQLVAVPPPGMEAAPQYAVAPAHELPPQPVAAAPAEPVFSVESHSTEPSNSLSGYLEATMKGDKNSNHLLHEKSVPKAGEENKRPTIIRPEVVARCEDAVAAVRAENALSMVPLGRVIIQQKSPGSFQQHSTDQVSCFRSPLFDLSNPSFLFTTPPLHDFVSTGLKMAARKLRRSQQSRKPPLRNAGATAGPRPAEKDGPRRSVSIAVNTEISCGTSEWCCKCRAYNVGTAASGPSARHGVVAGESQPSAVKRKHPDPRAGTRGPSTSKTDNGDDSDVEIVSVDAQASRVSLQPPKVPHLVPPPKGILKGSKVSPENHDSPGPPTSSLKSGKHPSHLIAPRGPLHRFSSFSQLALNPENLHNLTPRRYFESIEKTNT